MLDHSLFSINYVEMFKVMSFLSFYFPQHKFHWNGMSNGHE